MQYASPTSLDEAIDLLSQGGAQAKPMAGGTDLLVQMRTGRSRPDLVVDLKKIPGLRDIEESPDGFRIGAAVSGAELGEHQALREAWPGVVEATELIGSTQVQGRASLGGNLCNASPAADSVPALIAAGAVCSMVGPKGRRELLVEDVVLGPGQTALEAGEIIVDFRLPRPALGTGDAYLRMIPRTEMDIAIVGAGVSLTLSDSGECLACRVALGAVAARPLRVDTAAAALLNITPDAAALAELEAAASAATDPIDDKRGTRAYRTKVAGVLARRAAEEAIRRARRQRDSESRYPSGFVS